MRGKKQKEPAGMNPGEIFAALELLEQERGIPKEAMLEKVIKAITTAYQRDHKDVEEENIVVEADEVHQGAAHVHPQDRGGRGGLCGPL